MGRRVKRVRRVSQQKSTALCLQNINTGWMKFLPKNVPDIGISVQTGNISLNFMRNIGHPRPAVDGRVLPFSSLYYTSM